VAQAEDYAAAGLSALTSKRCKLDVIYTPAMASGCAGPMISSSMPMADSISPITASAAGAKLTAAGFTMPRADGSLIRELAYPLNTPNGVGLSPDGGEVYVAETDTGHLGAFDIAGPGQVPEGRAPWRPLSRWPPRFHLL
jgi:gluconolactonase